MSGRIRTIKPEWLEDELVATAPDHVRILTVGLILLADDYGCGRGAVNFIASEVWKYDRSPEVLTKVRDGLERLSALRFIRLYEVDGQSYFEIRSWSKHQKVQHVGNRRVPEPPPEIEATSTARKPRKKAPEKLTNSTECLSNPPETFTPDPTTTTTTTTTNKDVGQADGSVGSGEVECATATPVQAVWDAYLGGWRAHVGKGAEPKLTDARRAKIRARIKDHGADLVTAAAGGIWRSSWHVENGHTDIDLAMRDASKIERFAAEPRAAPPSNARKPWEKPVQPAASSSSQSLEDWYRDHPPTGDPI